MRWMLSVLLLLVSCGGPSKEGEACRGGADCEEGLVCLLWEDSQEGACFPPECADKWYGYGCNLDTGTEDTGP